MVKKLIAGFASGVLVMSSIVSGGFDNPAEPTFFVCAAENEETLGEGEYIVPLTYSTKVGSSCFTDNNGTATHFNANAILTIDADNNQSITIGVENWSLYTAFVPTNCVFDSTMEKEYPEKLFTLAQEITSATSEAETPVTIDEILPNNSKCTKRNSDLDVSFLWNNEEDKVEKKFGAISVDYCDKNLDFAYVTFPINDYKEQFTALTYYTTNTTTDLAMLVQRTCNIGYVNFVLDSDNATSIESVEQLYASDNSVAFGVHATMNGTWQIARTNFAGYQYLNRMISRASAISDDTITTVRYYFSSSFDELPTSVKLPISRINSTGSYKDWYLSPFNSNVTYKELPIQIDADGYYFEIQYDMSNKYDWAFGKEVFIVFNESGNTRYGSVVPFLSDKSVEPIVLEYTENKETVITIETDTTRLDKGVNLNIEKNRSDIVNQYFSAGVFLPDTVLAYTIGFIDDDKNVVKSNGSVKLTIKLPDDFTFDDYCAIKIDSSGIPYYHESISIGKFDLENLTFTTTALSGETYGFVKTCKRTDISQLPKGVYEVKADFIRYGNKNQSSMSNAALEHSAYLIVNDNDGVIERKLYLNFHDMSYEGQDNLYIGDLYCDDGYWYVNESDSTGTYTNSIVYKDTSLYTKFAVDSAGELIDNAIYDAITEYACIEGAVITLKDDSYNKDRICYNMAIASPVMSALSSMPYAEIEPDSLCVDLVFTNVKPSDKSEDEVKEMFSYDVSALTRQVRLAERKLADSSSYSAKSLENLKTAYNNAVKTVSDADGNYDPLNTNKVSADKLEELGTNLENAIKALDSITVAGYSAKLNENIKFDFDLSFNEDVTAAVKAGKVNATVTNADGTTKDVKISKDGKITFEVAPKEIGNDLVVKVGEYEFTYSVQDYLEKLIWYYENPTTGVEVSEKEANIAKSMLVYGGYAQDYFVKKNAEANAYVDTDRVYANVDSTLPETAENASVFEAPELGENIQYYGSAVVFDYTTGIRLYFTVDDEIENHTFAVNDEAVTPVAVDGGYYIAIDDIYANQLGNAFKVTVDNKNFQYGVYNYIAAALNATEVKSGALNELQNLVKALYQYAELTKTTA